MASLNRVMLIGNVGKDPEVRTVTNGSKVATFSLATSESWKDKATGEKKERTEWHKVVIFGNLAEVVDKYVHKGSKLYVAGQLQTRKWLNKEGEDRYTTEVVLQAHGGELIMLDGKPNGTTAPKGQGPAHMDDDSIPFSPEWR